MRIHSEEKKDNSFIFKGVHKGESFVAQDDGSGLYIVSCRYTDKQELLKLISDEVCLPVKEIR